MGLLSWLSRRKESDSANTARIPAADSEDLSIDDTSTEAARHGSNSPVFLSALERMKLKNQYRGSMLVMGIVEENPRIVEQGLRGGENPNQRYSYDEDNDSVLNPYTIKTITPIVQAAVNGNIEIVKLLLEYGADPNFCQRNGETALADAANRGDTKLVNYLLEHGADPNVPTPIGTPLALADGIGVMRELLEHGADPNIPDEDGDLPIVGSIDTRRLDEIELLIKYGTNLSHRNNMHETPIDRARIRGVYDAIQRMIGRDSVQDPQTTSLGREERYDTPDLFIAAHRGNLAEVQRLLNDGANPDVKLGGCAAIYQPIMRGYNDVCFALLDAGADPNIILPGELFPIYIAAEFGNLALVKKLVACGAEIDKETPRGNTALRNAAEEGRYEVVKYLLENGADANSVNKVGLTILDAAEHYGYDDIATLIRRYCSDGDSAESSE